MAAALAAWDRNGWTPLDSAIRCAQPEGAAAEGVRLLVVAGADATVEHYSMRGYTALHRAAEYGPDDPSLAGVLMGAGCDPAAKDDRGRTALDLAQEEDWRTEERPKKPRMATPVSYTHLTLPTILLV